MADESAAKTEEPTPKKLADARKKGDVAKSMDVPQLASLAAAFGVLAIGGASHGSILLILIGLDLHTATVFGTPRLLP
jgi:flagellar biosynthesis protein FlhB